MSDQDPTIDQAEYRRVLGHFPTGVTVVTAKGAEGPVGVAIGSFASISLEPPLVGFYLGTHSSNSAPLIESGHFCVNILCHDQAEFGGLMASKAPDKFDNVPEEPAPGSGAPILPDVHAYIDCRIERVIELGDHNLIVGRVLALEHRREALPLVFYKGNYGSFGA